MSLQLTDAQKVALTAHAVDAAGQPAVDANALTWASSDESIVTVAPNADGTPGAEATAVGPVGTATVSVTDGTLSGTVDIEVIGGPATAITVAAGTPEAK